MGDFESGESSFIKNLLKAAELKEEIDRLREEIGEKEKEYKKIVLEIMKTSPVPAEIFRDSIIQMELEQEKSTKT